MLLYIHGFRSVGLCYKGSLIKEFSEDSLTPNLPYAPKLAIKLLEEIILKNLEQSCKISLIGSSLGGYYAIYLAHKFNLKAVLVNPAVYAYRNLSLAIGKVNVPYSGETFLWTQDLVEDLKELEVKNIDYKLFMVLLQKGDEVLDYREAALKLKDSKLLIYEGGSHRFDNFEMQKENILQWCS